MLVTLKGQRVRDAVWNSICMELGPFIINFDQINFFS